MLPRTPLPSMVSPLNGDTVMQKNVFAGVLTSQEGGTLSKFECKDTKNIWNMQIWEGEKLRNLTKTKKAGYYPA